MANVSLFSFSLPTSNSCLPSLSLVVTASSSLPLRLLLIALVRRVHRAACVRCKNLKVRCEFLPNSQLLGDAAVCRRCSNGNHKCEIPGRKKRRQPPKREHLLNQIRDQATEIERMRSMLDGFMKRMSRDGARLIHFLIVCFSNIML